MRAGGRVGGEPMSLWFQGIVGKLQTAPRGSKGRNRSALDAAAKRREVDNTLGGRSVHLCVLFSPKGSCGDM